jgi:hypothetical protein
MRRFIRQFGADFLGSSPLTDLASKGAMLTVARRMQGYFE